MEADGHYSGLLVDYGGVLTTSPFLSFSSFCELEGLEPQTIIRRFREDESCRKLIIDLETGAVSEEEFEPQFADLLGVPGAQLIDRLFAAYGPDEEMIAAVGRAREAGVRTGLISNSWGTRRYDRAGLADLFDGVVISGEVGMRKPSPEIYRLGAQRAGVDPERAVFVDDIPVNLPPAQERGMATVQPTSAGETVGELERLLGIPLR